MITVTLDTWLDIEVRAPGSGVVTLGAQAPAFLELLPVAVGPKGETGDKGDTGETGAPGEPGQRGEPGPQGDPAPARVFVQPSRPDTSGPWAWRQTDETGRVTGLILNDGA